MPIALRNFLFFRVLTFRIHLFLLFIFFPAALAAQPSPSPQLSPRQQKKADSLRQLLGTLPQDTARVNALLELGRVFRDKDIDGAMNYLLQAKRLAASLSWPKGLGRSENYLAYIWQKKSMEDTALAYYRLALKHGREAGDTHTETAAGANMGNFFYERSRPDSSLKYYEAAYALADRTKNKFQVYNTLNGIAGVYSLIDNEEKAMEYMNKLFEKSRAAGDMHIAANTINNIGTIADERGRHLEAIGHYRQAIGIFGQVGETRLSYIYVNISRAYIRLLQHDSTLFYGKLAARMAREENDERQLAKAYFSMGMAESALGLADSALVHARHAADLGRKGGLGTIVQDALGLLSQVYKQKGDYKTALDYSERMSLLKDSLDKEENRREIHKVQALFDTDRKDKEIALLSKQKELDEERSRRDSMMLYAAGGGLVLVMLLLVMLFSRYRDKQRSNRLLAGQNAEITRQRDEIGVKNKEITDSINYAQRIQSAVLPDGKILQQLTRESFLLYRPRDIVSGDFYWFARKGPRFYIAVADCTGHGVPGALVSVIGINILNQIIERSAQPGTDEILAQLHRLIIQALNKDVQARETNDGMDIALLCIDTEKREAEFSGAARPLFVAGPDGLQLIRGDRFSIGGVKDINDTVQFAVTRIPLDRPLSFYMTTDGYADQFGEESGKKFLSRRFQALLGTLGDLPMEQQSAALDKAFLDWKGKLEQVDDVLVLGLKTDGRISA